LHLLDLAQKESISQLALSQVGDVLAVILKQEEVKVALQYLWGLHSIH
jgi:hypothetical protein